MTQAPFPMSGTPPFPPRAPGPGMRASLILMTVGVVIGIASVVAIVVPLLGTFTSSEYVVPAHLSLHLRHSRYTVYERTGSRSGFVTRTGIVTIDPSQVVVTGPDGQPVFVQQDLRDETVNRGSRVFTGAVRFDVAVTGQYDVRLSTTRGATSVVIARSIDDAIRSVLVWFATAAIGGLVALAGLVMLIVGSTRRGRARRAAQFGWGYPPPGYQPQGYPPPVYPPPVYPPPVNPPQPGPPKPGPPNDPWAPPPPWTG